MQHAISRYENPDIKIWSTHFLVRKFLHEKFAAWLFIVFIDLNFLHENHFTKIAAWKKFAAWHFLTWKFQCGKIAAWKNIWRIAGIKCHFAHIRLLVKLKSAFSIKIAVNFRKFGSAISLSCIFRRQIVKSGFQMDSNRFLFLYDKVDRKKQKRR